MLLGGVKKTLDTNADCKTKGNGSVVVGS